MKNLFEKNAHDEITARLDKLSPVSGRQWGKMDVAQMLAHCKQAFKVPFSEQKQPRKLAGRLMSWMFKAKTYNDDPIRKNLPTSPEFIIRHNPDFKQEMDDLKKLVDQFYHTGPLGISKHPHPFFGKYTTAQWGQFMYKHLDHHLVQFGV